MTHQHLHYPCQQSVMHSTTGAFIYNIPKNGEDVAESRCVTCHVGFRGCDRKPQSGQDNSQGFISTAVQCPEVGCPVGMAQAPPKGKQSPEYLQNQQKAFSLSSQSRTVAPVSTTPARAFKLSPKKQAAQHV